MKRPRRKEASGHQGLGETLRDCVRNSMEKYFEDLDGERPCDMYKLVLAEVEGPLLETIMQHTRGNQSLAAECLGISRSTLRKKLKAYQLD